MSWPLFDAGRIRANISVQNAVQEEVLATYERAVLTALQDVEKALVAYSKEQEHHAALVTAVAADQRAAIDLATRLFASGNKDFLSVLDAQRSLYGAQDALVQSTRNIATDLVALYKALGGGWEIEVDPPRDAASAK